MVPLKATETQIDGETKPDATAEVSVTYWLRLLIEGSKRKGGTTASRHWATHPILLLPVADAGSV
jgi:hypothetical protein